MELNDMFDAETNGDALDEQLVTAGAVLEKMAADLNLDLSSLGDDVVAGYLAELMPAAPQTEKIATAAEGAPMEQQQEAGLTYPEVFAELTKIAAAEQVDLTKLSTEEMAETIQVLAEQMADPSYGKVAEEVVQARQLGAEMAIGFAEKMAEFQAAEKAEEKSEKKDEAKDDGEKEASAFGAGLRAGQMREGAKKLVGAAKEKTRGAVNKGLEGYSTHGEKVRAGAALAGAAGAGAVAGRASKRDKTSKDEAFEAAALNRAAEMLKAAGIDPETGEKVASEEDIDAAAIELLRAKGYEV